MNGLKTEGNFTTRDVNYSIINLNFTLGNDYTYGKKLIHDKEGVEKSFFL